MCMETVFFLGVQVYPRMCLCVCVCMRVNGWILTIREKEIVLFDIEHSFELLWQLWLYIRSSCSSYFVLSTHFIDRAASSSWVLWSALYWHHSTKYANIQILFLTWYFDMNIKHEVFIKPFIMGSLGYNGRFFLSWSTHMPGNYWPS